VQARFRAMFFDLDGTLADTLSLIYRAFNDALTPVTGQTYAGPEIRSWFGPPDTQIIRKLLAEAHVDGAIERYMESYRRHHADLVRVFPGIDRLLTDCHEAGARIAVITGKSRETAVVTLDALGLSKDCDLLYGGDDVERQKPDPMALELALKEFSVDRDEAVMIGDAAADVLAGKAAGVSTIGVLWGNPDHSQLLQSDPTWLVATVSELEPLLLTR
jgi:pyrophosphatase PpaX